MTTAEYIFTTREINNSIDVVARRDPAQNGGLEAYDVRISDGWEAEAEKRQEIIDEMNLYDEALREHPEWQAPEFTKDSNGEAIVRIAPENIAAQRFYAGTMREWGKQMPTALALHNLYVTEAPLLPNGAEIDDRARDIFRHSLDAIGIRTRANVARAVVSEYAREFEGDEIRELSLACGAAVPVVNIAKEVQNIRPDIKMPITLVDLDDNALNLAKTYATENGLVENQDFRTYNGNLITNFALRNTLVGELYEDGKRPHIIDALGFFEYLPKETRSGRQLASSFTEHAYESLAPGGKFIFANMLDDRSQLAFNQRGVGWPKIFPRSIEECAEIIEQAGIPKENVKVYIPEDGVYAVYEITKPHEVKGSVAAIGNRATEGALRLVA